VSVLFLLHEQSLYIGWQWRNFFISAVFCCYSDVSRRHFLNKVPILRTFS